MKVIGIGMIGNSNYIGTSQELESKEKPYSVSSIFKYK